MIACVQIKYFAAAVARAADPMLLGVPVILVRYTKERGRVAAVSAEAEQAGVQPGMALSRARAVCPGGCFLMLDAQHGDEALDTLLEVLWTFTHQVEIDETAYPQTVVAYLDLGRLNLDDLAVLGSQITETVSASTSGGVTVGIAAGKFPAFVAAQAGQIELVAPGEETAFVAPHPVTLLPLSKATTRKLRLLFIRRLDELAAISRPELVAQFGKPGRLLYWLARGIDPRPVTPRRMPQSESAERRLEHSLTDRTRVDYLVQMLADELAIRLEGRVAAAHHLTLGIEYERGIGAVERLHLIEPVATARGIAQALQPLVERCLPSVERGGITRVEIRLQQLVSAAPRQLDLLTHRPARQQLIDLLPALVERYGACFYEAQIDEAGALLPERRFSLRQAGN